MPSDPTFRFRGFGDVSTRDSHRFALFISSMISRVYLTVLDHGHAWLKVVAYGVKTVRLASW